MRAVPAARVVLAAVGASLGLALVAACTLLATVAPAGADAPRPTPYDLAVGGSGSVGFQPTLTHPHGAPTASGYSDVLAAREAARWPGLTLVRVGCPGTTTLTMMQGGGNCLYRDGSQLQAAVNFLRTHPSTVLVTVDLGFNDVVRCLHDMNVNGECVTDGLANVQAQLPRILAALRQAAPEDAQIVGVGHYDPYLGDYVRGPAGRDFAIASLGIMERLNEIMRVTYAKAGIPMADVAAAFGQDDTSPTAAPGLGTVPTDVAHVCTWTWMCAAPPLGPNMHPNDAGYRVIAGAVAAMVKSD